MKAEPHIHRLARSVLYGKAPVTHFSEVGATARTICGRTGALRLVDDFDPRPTCDHCLRVKEDAELGNHGNGIRASALKSAQRRLDNKGAT